VRITDHDRNITFDISWSRPGEGYLEFRLKTPEGILISPDTPARMEGIVYISRPTYQMYFLKEEFLKSIKRGGEWTIEVAGPREEADAEEVYHYGVLMESDLKLVTEFNQETYHTHEPMGLQVQIRENGKRIPATVKVRVQRPRRSTANWMVRHAIDPRSLNNIDQPGHRDSLSGIQRKAKLLLSKLDKPFSTDPQQTVLILYDDGTNGDLKADDRVYTTKVSLTRTPGTYVFDIIAQGTTKTGQSFRRQKLVQKYLRIKPDEKSTIVKLESLAADSQGIRSYRVTVFPRDGLGNYLGPGFADQIYFSIRGSRLIGTVQDHLNGGYSQKYEVPVDGAEEKSLIMIRILDVKMLFYL
jgi:hypothetical protein